MHRMHTVRPQPKDQATNTREAWQRACDAALRNAYERLERRRMRQLAKNDAMEAMTYEAQAELDGTELATNW